MALTDRLDPLWIGASVLVSAITGMIGLLNPIIGWIAPYWSIIASTADQWFTIGAVFLGTVAPNVPSIGQETATQALVAIAALFLLIKLRGFITTVAKKLRRNT